MLVRACVEAGMQVSVASTDDDGPGKRREVPLGRAVAGAHGSTSQHFPRQLEFYTVSLPLWRWLRSATRNFDVIHVHALFSFPSIVAAREAHRAGVPYIVRPLGVLNRWGLEHRRPLLKRASLRAFEIPLIRRAAAMHYTSAREQEEAESIDPAIQRTRGSIIPLPIEVPEPAAPAAVRTLNDRFPQLIGREMILFLSRIDPKKGIELLFEAFAAVRREFPQALLMIAGEGDEGYVNALKKSAERLGIAGDVVWPGFLAGEQKRAAFASAAAFVLPSYSENFGIAAAEALAAGIPVLLSDQVAVADDVRDASAGLVVSCNAAAIAEGLRQLLANAALRDEFAARGRALVTERYSSAAVGQQLRTLYESVMQSRSRSS